MYFLFLTAELTNSATGYCAKTVANGLAKRGHYVYVLSENIQRKRWMDILLYTRSMVIAIGGFGGIVQIVTIR